MKAFKEQIADREKEIALLRKLESAGLEEYVNFVSSSDIFFHHDIDVMKARKLLRKMAQVSDDKMMSYNMNNGKLSVTYQIGDTDRVYGIFFYSDYAEVLEKISRGRCRVETATRVEIEKVVVCEQ